MWMQLASRAFSTGASANKGLPDNESQAMVQEPLVILPLSLEDDDQDGYDDAAGVNPAEGVHLTNPSMNELMRHLHTANQQAVIVSEQAQAQAQANLQRCRLQQQAGFKAIDNDSIFAGEPKPDPLAFMRMVGGMDQHRHQMGHLSLNCYPHFDLPLSVQGICSNVAPNYLHRALSLDDLHHLEGVSSGGPLLWRVHSEGSLITMPGDGNLAQQMATLKPAYEEILMQSGPKTGASRRTPRQRPKVADMEPSDLAALLSPEQRFTFNSKEFQAPTHKGNVCYWISLAHLLVVVACLRGGL